MIAIADSGSSKTLWAIIDKNALPLIFSTKGYNPYHTDSESIIRDFCHTSQQWYKNNDIEHVYFFGAGCADENKKQIIRNALSVIFPQAELNVSSDLHGASIALFGNKSGITCILGTGSSAALWDGIKLYQNTPSLGYILGDEGSGAFMGIRFLRAYLRNEFDKETAEYFAQHIKLSHSEILDKIYNHNEAKPFLASFVNLMSTKTENRLIKNIVEDSFQQYIKTFILTIPNYRKFSIGFCGSPAYYFSQLLLEALQTFGLSSSKIIQSPMDGLIEFYCPKQ